MGYRSRSRSRGRRRKRRSRSPRKRRRRSLSPRRRRRRRRSRSRSREWVESERERIESKTSSSATDLPSASGNSRQVAKEGEWRCAKCKFLNFAKRFNCYLCGENKPMNNLIEPEKNSHQQKDPMPVLLAWQQAIEAKEKQRKN